MGDRGTSAEDRPVVPLRHTDYAGLPVTVMGLGHFGGSIGALRYLCRHGARVTLTESQPRDRLEASWARVSDLPLHRAYFGGHASSHVGNAALVVASPAIRPDHPLLRQAHRQGAQVTTEIGLFLDNCHARLIGITGTAGKSTTAAATAHLLRHTGRQVHLGGNIGGSLLDSIDTIRPDDWVVLELSSFQLSYLQHSPARFNLVALTNFAPNHLDWHGSVEEYRAAKQQLFRLLSPQGIALVGADAFATGDWPTTGTLVRVGDDRADVALDREHQLHLRVGERRADVDLSGLPSFFGQHMLRNAAMAATAAWVSGVDADQLRAGLESYVGLPHRMQSVGTVAGRTFIDDSKATTPQAAIAALRSLTECHQRVVLLAGGSDKGVCLNELAAAITESVQAVACLGDTGPTLHRAITQLAPGFPATVATDFNSALEWTFQQSRAGDTILLSPGCASFDWFRDYADRGAQFCQFVNRLCETIDSTTLHDL